MKIDQALLVTMVEGIEGEADIPEAVNGWIDQIKGDSGDSTALELALSGAMLNSIDRDDLEDQLGDLIHELNMVRHNLENQR